MTTIIGGPGPDTLTGTSSDDVITGYAGADILTGGSGSDRFVYTAVSDSPRDAYDLILDFQTGQDTLDLTGLGAGMSVAISRQETYTTVFYEPAGGGAQGLISIKGIVAGSDLLLPSSAKVYVTGSPQSESLTGSDLDDVIYGRGGGDTLTGGLGADVFLYLSKYELDFRQAHPDVITDFQTGLDKIDVTALAPFGSLELGLFVGKSTVFNFYVDDIYTLGTIEVIGTVQPADLIVGSDVVVTTGGSTASDTIVGRAVRDIIRGDDGDDRIVGGGGGDTLTGGSGADTFVYNAVGDSAIGAPDMIADFTSGTDRIDFTGLGDGVGVAINLIGTQTMVFYQKSASGPQDLIGVTGTVQLSDLVLPTNAATFLTGSDGPDTLLGSGQADLIRGGSGADRITGGLGADKLYGGSGSDTFVYGSVSDSPRAAADGIGDFVTGSDKLDFLGLGGGASVAFDLGQATTTFYFQAATGPQGAVTLWGAQAQAADLLLPLGSTLYLGGTAASETLIAGTERDVLTGRGGADTFVFKAVSASPTSAADLITDFDPNQDFIDLSGIDANSGTTGLQHFTLVAGFTAAAGQLVSYVSCGFIHFDGDVNGDGVADFAILVTPTAYWDPYADPSHLRL